MWNVEFTDEFEQWWNELDDDAQASVAASVRLLENLGPELSRPHADTLNGSKNPNMKELRTVHQGNALRTFFAFDPTRVAILLIGGDKSGAGDKRFYEQMIREADRLYGEHLNELKDEGLLS